MNGYRHKAISSLNHMADPLMVTYRINIKSAPLKGTPIMLVNLRLID